MRSHADWRPRLDRQGHNHARRHQAPSAGAGLVRLPASELGADHRQLWRDGEARGGDGQGGVGHRLGEHAQPGPQPVGRREPVDGLVPPAVRSVIADREHRRPHVGCAGVDVPAIDTRPAPNASGEEPAFCARLAAAGVDTGRVRTSYGASGVAVIMVDRAGENAILIRAGAAANPSSATVGALRFLEENDGPPDAIPVSAPATKPPI